MSAASERLGFRPDVHLDWPPGTLVTPAVADAVQDALDISLERIATRGGSTSAIVSLAWRGDTIELCVVDDGCVAGAHGRRDVFGVPQLDARIEVCGLEHDVDQFGDAGVCQWWSIPVDLS
ncbi:MAG TPA: hypothetical protein VF183_10125 [Acidimicrobiales bacterium]